MHPEESEDRGVSPGVGTSDRLMTGFLRVTGVVMVALAVHRFIKATSYEGLLWIAGALFCLGASFDPANVARALIGRVDLLGGRLRMGHIGKGLLYASFACGLLAIIFRQRLI